MGHKAVRTIGSLTGLHLINRVLGSLFRILMVRWVGAEGMGLVSVISPLMALADTLGTLGLPPAVARLVASRKAKGDGEGALRGVETAGLMVLVVSLALALFFEFLRPGMIEPRVDPRLHFMLRFFPFMIVIGAVHSILQGAFQGQKALVPMAGIHLGEQAVRILVAYGLISIFSPELAYGLLAALISLILAEIVGLTSMTGVLYRLDWANPPAPISPPGLPMRRRERRHTSGFLRDLKQLLHLSIPILGSRLVDTGAYALLILMIPLRLRATGLSATEALADLGRFTGMAMPLFMLPMVLIVPLSSFVLPSIADLATRGRKKILLSRLHLALTASVFIGCGAGLCLAFLANPLTALLYGTTEAAGLLVLLAWGTPFISLHSISSATLHGLGRTRATFVASLCGTIIRLGLTFLFTGVWGIQGTILALLIGLVASTGISLYLLQQNLKTL